MPRSILITSGKGGTGKSTVTHLLGRALADRDQNILLLELDSGLRGLDLMLGVSDRVVFDLSDVLSGACRPAQAIVTAETPRGNLHLLAAPIDRRFLPDPKALHALLRLLATCYDFVLLDTAAGLGPSLDLAASVAEEALLVTTADRVSARDVSAAAQLLACPSRLVINRFLTRDLGGDMPTLDSVIDCAGVQLLSVIPFDPAVPAANAAGRALPASSRAKGEFDDLARRLLGERVPLNQKRLRG